MYNEISSNNHDGFLRTFGFGFIGAMLVVFACFLLGACNTTTTRWSVVEYDTNNQDVRGTYTAKNAPVRHGDYLVFEDSASHLLVRVRYSHAVVGLR